MAFEGRCVGQFPPLLLGNRDLMAMNYFGDGCGVQMGNGVLNPVSGTSTATEMGVPLCGRAVCDSYGMGGLNVKSNSCLTCAVPALRKRSRVETVDPSLESGGVSNGSHGGVFSLLGNDFSAAMQQQQLEIDRYIALHTEKVRAEVESHRRKFSRRISPAVEDNILKKLRAKDEEIEKIGKLNWALEERVKSLSVENQIWKDLAQTNEATANTLRCNLQQALSQVQYRAADEESSCSSSTPEAPVAAPVSDAKRLCRSCRIEESSVLLLPCRHLCLCTSCVSSLRHCPVCNSVKTGTLQVNLSAS